VKAVSSFSFSGYIKKKKEFFHNVSNCNKNILTVQVILVQ
jgi:hypothetical protein